MIRITIILFCFLITIHACADVNTNQNECQLHHCLAVVDAGSTGSRLHIYAYDLDAENNPTHINHIWNKKNQPGFANIALDQNRIDQYLNELFNDSPYHDLPIYFYATGGMRLLPQEQQTTRYKALKQWFSTHKEWQLMDSKTISGQDEGLYGWLAVNYQLGTFNQNDDAQLVGFMDMGGASVQIAFPIHNTENMSSTDFVEVDINGKHISLFIHSFLGLGQTEIIKPFLDKEQCFSNDYSMLNGSIGQGDANRCQLEVSELINTTGGTDKLVKPILTNNPISTWYTMGGLNMLATTQLFDFNELKMTSKQFLAEADKNICKQSWKNVLAADPENERTPNYCLISSYYYALIVNGYGLKPTETIHFMPTQQSSDWSLGVVLHHQ